MNAYTIAIGETFRQIAEITAPRMEAMSGLPVTILTESVLDPAWTECFGPDAPRDPSWAKLLLPEIFPADTFLYFDADIYCMKEWDPREFIVPVRAGRAMAIVKDVDSERTLKESRDWSLPLHGYFNAGLWMVRAATMREPFRLARGFFPDGGSWYEQTALNFVLWRMQVEPLILPRAYNTLLWPQKDDYTPAALAARRVVNLHFASLPGAQALQRIKTLNNWMNVQAQGMDRGQQPQKAQETQSNE